jgi:hypothetical protein
MKTNVLSTTTITGVLLLFCAGVSEGQTAAAGAPGFSDYSIVQQGPHSRLWRNSAGQTVTEIATGMNRWDGQEWIPSDPSFEVSPDGTAFVASQIQAPTRLAANLDCVGAVSVTTPEPGNVTLRSTPIAIGLYDAASGQSVIVATLTNTPGVLVDPRRVVYDRALVGGGFAASVVYSLPDTGSFHQDVVFVGFDPGFDPTAWGFAAASTNTLQIQIITEFYDPPQPQMQARPLYVEQDPDVRASMASPDLIDYTLDWGHYVFGAGRAYTTSTNDSASAGVTVAKEFVTSSGRSFLVEKIPFRWLAGELYSLPPVRVRTSSLQHPLRATKTRFAALSLPSLRDKPAAVEKITPARTAARAVAKPHGVVVDYVVTVSSTVEPTLYSSDTTYFVSGTVYNASPVTMESAVFKFPTNNVGCIEIESTLTMATTNYRPAIFSAADDNTCGAMLSTNIWSGYTGNPGTNYYGNIALCLNMISNIALNNLRFCYQYCAIETPAGASSGQVVTLSHAQLVDCITGISVNAGSGVGTNGGGGQQEEMMGGSSGGFGGGNIQPLTKGGGTNSLALTLNNCLMANVQYPFDYSGNNMQFTGNAYNCTIDSCTNLFYIGGSSNTNMFSFTFTNSIFSSVSSIKNSTPGSFSLLGGHNGFYNSPTFGSSYTTVSSNPYQSVGAGNYYLYSGSPFLTNGTTNIGAALLSQLQMKTTQPPLLLINSFTSDTVLMPVAQRDTAGTALGVHYDPIDYIAACSVSNATLFLVNGVALAYYDNLGIWLQDGGQLVSQGTPNYRNYLVYYGLVQEQPGVVTNALAQALPIAPSPFGSSANPSIFLRLTTICAPQGETNLLNTGDTGQVISNLTLRDCEVYGAGANWQMNESTNTPVVGLTNNVFHRVPFAISNNATVTSFNNLFYGTTNTNGFTISIRHRGANSPNTNENNVFDGVTASLDGLVGYNAYLHGATNTTFKTNDIRTNLTWLAGPLGSYYQPTNSPLINKGSTTANQLGLYDYTVTTNLINGLEIKETNSIVDLGYHYVAVNSNGIPIDTISNGIPDYLEDSTNNGLPSWWLMEYFGTVDISSNADYDASGLTVLQDYQQGLDPNVIAFNLSVTNQYVKTGSVPLQIALTAGIPYYMAALVDDTNWAHIHWIPYNPFPIVSVGTNQGWHQIWFGLRGLPPTGQQTWAWSRVKLLTPPLLVVTNPSSATVMQPIIEVQGFSPEPLASLSFDLSNAAGLFTNQQALVLSQHYDSNTSGFTTNSFQAFDVPLTNGANLLTFYATDPAGNVTVTNFTYTLDYSAKTNPPAIQIYWPQNGDQVSGTEFTLRGSLNDFTASLTAEIVDSSGDTNVIQGLVERNGLFWVENVPLLAGANYVTLTAMDAVSNIATTNLTINCVNPGLTIDDFSGGLGGTQRDLVSSVSGGISLSGYTLWVNGVQATQDGQGNWAASSVPLGPGGTAVVEARAIPNSDNNGNGTGTAPPTDGTPSNPTAPDSVAAQTQIDQPPFWYVAWYQASGNTSATATYCGGCPEWSTTASTWNTGAGYLTGGTAKNYQSTASGDCNSSYTSWQNTAYNWQCDSCVGTVTVTYSEGNSNTYSTGPQFGSWLSDFTLFSPSGMEEFAWSENWSRPFPQGDCQTNTYSNTEHHSICSETILLTGGKGIPNVKNLFEIYVTATQYFPPGPPVSTQLLAVWWSQPIPPGQITLLGQSPGSDGMLPIMLEDNATLEFTAQTPFPNYTYSVNPVKIPTTLTANDIDLATTTPTFCVGQQVIFSLNIPAEYTNAAVNFNLPQKFVNEPWQEQECIDGVLVEFGSVNYRVDPALLSYNSSASPLTTPCWYVNLPGGAVSANARLDFPNGKTVYVIKNGSIIIYRPSIVQFIPPSGPIVNLVGGNIQLNNLSYSVQVLSQYPGNGDFTQIISRQAQNGSSAPTTIYGYLDNFPFYMAMSWTPPGTYSVSKNVLSRWPFQDSPCYALGYGTYGNTTSISDQFADYIILCPSQGTGNIYVTLGTVSWSWTSSTTYTNGNWTPPIQVGIHAPTGNDTSDSFPVWTNVFNP